MQPVIINGYLYYVKGDQIFDEGQVNFTMWKHLTRDERQQVNKYLNNFMYQEYVKEWMSLRGFETSA